jgi:hypothetical protein
MTSVDMRKRLVGMEVRIARPVADLLCAEEKSRLAVAMWLSHPDRRSYQLPNRRERYIDPDGIQDVVEMSVGFRIVRSWKCDGCP